MISYPEFVIKYTGDRALDPNYDPMLDVELLYYYAKYMTKDKWPEGEHVIMKDSKWAYHYAVEVINGRWHEAEPYIMQNKYWWNKYKKHLTPDPKPGKA